VDELVTAVAGASAEQSQGIQQVNSAVTQMDKVTQANAAGAEESASAAQELNAQADLMKQAVGELLQLVGGASTDQDIAGYSPAPEVSRPVLPPEARTKSKELRQLSVPSRGRANGPQAIPLEQGFKEF
jgi:methyl-accepting chemotaxis protein